MMCSPTIDLLARVEFRSPACIWSIHSRRNHPGRAHATPDRQKNVNAVIRQARSGLLQRIGVKKASKCLEQICLVICITDQ